MLRLLPPRHRALVAADGEAIRNRRPGSPWTTLECAAHVGDVFQRCAVLLGRFLANESPVADSATIEAPRASVSAADPEAVLASLEAATEQLARIIEKSSPHDWLRLAVRGERQATAAELAWEAVHEGTHHLAEAQSASDGARPGLGAEGVGVGAN